MIPNVFHFVYLSRPLMGVEPLSFMFHHYIALKSCAETQTPDKIIVWSDGSEPDTQWWSQAKSDIPVLEFRVREMAQEIAGQMCAHLSHVCDIARAEILYEHGGVYADLDTLFVRDLAGIREETGHRFFAQSEGPNLPISSLIMAPAKHIFVKRWLERTACIHDGWVSFARDALLSVAETLPDQFLTMQLDSFNTDPVWTNAGSTARYAGVVPANDSYVFNECQHLDGNQRYLSMMNPYTVFEWESTFSRLARRFISRPHFGVTAIMPVSIDSSDRLENVYAVSRYVRDRLLVDEVIVVEYDTAPKLSGLFAGEKGIRYLFVSRSGDPWTKTRLVNTALPWVKTPITAIWDTDAIISIAQVRASCKAIREGASGVVPFNRLYHVPHSLLRHVKTGRVDHLGILNDENNILFTLDAANGQACVFFDTSKFRHARGANRLFWGWGGEDDEQVARMAILYGKMLRVRGPLLHISHERTEASYPIEGHGELNDAERARTYMWEPERIRQYLGITEEVGLYSELEKALPHDDKTRAHLKQLDDDGCMFPGSPMYSDGEGEYRLHAGE